MVTLPYVKTIHLIRHAKSSWKDLTLDDFDRPLNGRGKRAAPFMAQKFKERSAKIDQFISSPAKRAITTARIIAEAFNPNATIMEKREIYHAAVPTLLSVVNALSNEWERVALFGHNPGFTDFANYLSNAGIHNIPTAGIVHIDFDLDDWALVSQDTGTLTLFDYPKRYPELQG